MQIAVARATHLCRTERARTFSCYRAKPKNPLAIVVWKPWVTDQRWKIQGEVLHGILVEGRVNSVKETTLLMHTFLLLHITAEEPRKEESQ